MLKNKEIEVFKETKPSLESYWRAIILFGRNVSSYKFALAKSILEIAPTGKEVIRLEELAEPYARHLCEHLKVAPRQTTSRSSSFLNACKAFNDGEITAEKLKDKTIEVGFDYVLDAFHNVNGEGVDEKFYVQDSNKIVLTDNAFKLIEMPNSENFEKETEARWNLVENAWERKVSPQIMEIDYDPEMERFFFDIEKPERKDVTSARASLNGYQKGKCFYCYDNIAIDMMSPQACDVDHLIPYALQQYIPETNLNGVWNLVLACRPCNRGESGKFDKVPAIKYLERLYKRNEFLISSHHPLRETIMNQTGRTEFERRTFLQRIYDRASSLSITKWEIGERGEATF